jgi:RNA polymerase sigma-70 factor (ECF subfamily)
MLRAVQGGPGAAEEAPGVSRHVLEDFYEKHAAAVYARCRYLLRDDALAREAVLSVFAEAVAGQRSARPSPTIWMLRLATRHCLVLLRKRPEGAFVAAQRRDRRMSFAKPDRRELVRSVLGGFPLEVQETAVLFFVDELSQAQVAQAVGASAAQIRKALRAFVAGSSGLANESIADESGEKNG